MSRYSLSFPADWVSQPLSDLMASLTSGSRPAGGGTDNIAGVFSLGGEHITDDGRFTFENPQYVPQEHYIGIKDKADVAVGDILINKDGAKTGKLAIVRTDFPHFPACINEHLFRLRVNDQTIEPEYLFNGLLSDHGQRQIQSEVQGSAQGGIIRRFAKFIEIGYPGERKERQAILNYIRATELAMDCAREELEAAHCLKTALMQQLFTKGIPGRHKQFKASKWLSMPKSWTIKALHELADVSSGFTMGRDLSNHRTVIVPYVTVINVQDGFFDLSNIGSVQIKESELETGLLKPNDILMTEGGDRDKLGRGAIWAGQIDPCAYQNHIFRVRFQSDEYLPKLFHYLIQSWQAKRYFFSHAKQTNNLCTINSRELKKYPLGIPDPHEQKEIVGILDRCENTLNAITARIGSLLRLKKSLLQNLLTGKVRVNREAKV